MEEENQYSKTGVYPLDRLYSELKGEYVAECDGDDYWTDPLKLRKQVEFLDHNPEYVMCHHVYDIERDGQRTPALGHYQDFSQEGLVFLS